MKLHLIHGQSHTILHDDLSLGHILGVCPLSATERMDAQGTTKLMTIHQVHSQSHVNIHYDPSLCSSILGVYP